MKHNNYTANYSKGESIQNPTNLAGISRQLFRHTILNIFTILDAKSPSVN